MTYAIEASPSPISVLAIIEARVITGPAKNLIAFASNVKNGLPGCRPANITIVTYERGSPGRSSTFTAAAAAAGIRVEIVRERFVFDPGVLAQLRQIAAKCKPDIIQTHNVKSHFLTRLAGLHRTAAWLAFVHGYTWTNLKMRAYNQLDRWSLRAADQVITVCEAFARDIQTFGVRRDRITVQHNSVDEFSPASDAELTALRDRLGITAGELVLLAAGRLSREKGHGDLLDALATLQLDAGLNKYKLVIAGDGPERTHLERKATRLRIADRVCFAGHQNEMRPLYTLADVLILPSHTEGSPNVLLEAMAARKAIVATSVGGVPEIAEDGLTALLVPKRDVQRLGAAIDCLIRDRTLRQRLGANANRAALGFSSEQHWKSLLRLYDRVLRSRMGELRTRE